MTFLKNLLLAACLSVSAVCNAFTVDVSKQLGDLTGNWWVPVQANDYSPSRPESGWGLTLEQQYEVVFVQVYTYDKNKLPTWFVAVCSVEGNTCKGDLWKTSGGDQLWMYWTASVKDVVVGKVDFKFDSNTSAVFNITLPMDDTAWTTTVSKQIARLMFKTTPPAPPEQPILKLVNQLRATGANCGSAYKGPVSPVSWNDKLESAAYKHSLDMGTNNFFSHTGSDGSSPWTRFSREGFTGWPTGENIAAGADAIGAFEMWKNSPVHCSNMMNSSANVMGVGCATVAGSTYGTYCTMALGYQ